MRNKVIQRTLQGKLIAIVRGMAGDSILPLAEALREGGVDMMEVTFNQRHPESFSETTKSIGAIRKRFGDDVLVGAGTVITPEQAEMAAEAGALYIISPNVDVRVIARTRELGLVSMPGALTATEAQVAHTAGADFIKLFPAGDLGPGYLKALTAPLSHLSFLAVGGIDEKNMPAFRKAGALGFGIGGNLVNRELVAAGRWAAITELAKVFVAAAQ